jgi:hypothetical protein
MKLELSFKENSQKLDMSFGQFQDVTDGGFERGYEQGLVDGKQVGFDNAISKLTEIEIIENGRYTPENNSIGFSAVDVNIEGTEVIEQIIDESGVLDTEGTVTEKVEKLIDKAEDENKWYGHILTNISNSVMFSRLFANYPYSQLPRVDLSPTKTCLYYFTNSQLTSIDFYLDTKNSTNYNNAFQATKQLQKIKGLNTSNVTAIASMFNESAIETIEEPLDFSKVATTTKAFHCSGLKNILFKAETIKVSIAFTSPVLTAESVQSIIDGLATVTTAQTLTLHSAITLTDEQKATIKAKGWTLVQ